MVNATPKSDDVQECSENIELLKNDSKVQATREGNVKLRTDRQDSQESQNQSYLEKEFVEYNGKTHSFEDQEFYSFGTFRFGTTLKQHRIASDYIRQCNFVFVKEEPFKPFKDNLLFNYLKKSNSTPPKMILSVHGTGISETLYGGYAAGKAVKEQIYKAADETKAWIMTSGMRGPLNSLIGSARFEDRRRTADKVPIIGFPFFEDIKEKNAMKVQKSSNERRDGFYPDLLIDTRTSSLDENHSQFVMSRGNANRENPQLIHFRQDVKRMFKARRVPVVNILVSGDLNSLDSICNSLDYEDETPLIVFRGTGGAADILADSLEFLAVKVSELKLKYSNLDHGRPTSEEMMNRDEMVNILIKTFAERRTVEAASIEIPWDFDDPFDDLNSGLAPELSMSKLKNPLPKLLGKALWRWKQEWKAKREAEMWMDIIKKIFLMRKHQKITIFSLEQKKKLSQVLVENILEEKDYWSRELFVAMQMNSTSDVKAQLSKINLEGYKWLFTSASAYEMFFGAIAKNNFEIVSIFLEQGIKLSRSEEMDCKILEFFNGTFCGRLPALIKSKRGENFLGRRNLLDSEESTEFTVSELINGLRYLRKKYIGTYEHYDDEISNGDDSDPEIHRHLHPVEALFLWSLATENVEMAEIFWRESKSSALVNALVGAAACDCIFKEKNKYDTKNRTVLATYKMKFTELAIGLLDESIKEDIKKTRQFLTLILTEYGHLTPLEIAINGNVSALYAHSFIQDELDTIWLGRISKQITKWNFKYGLLRELVYYVTLLFPFAAPFWLEFDVKQPASYLTRLICFFNAPRTVYVYNFIFYTIYQGLFGYVLTMQFCMRPFFAERVLLCWTITLVLEELRQIANADGNNFLKKLQHWIQDEWNIMDMIGLIVHVIGFILKLSTVWQGKVPTPEPGNDACTLISGGPEECCPLQLSPEFQTSQILYTISFIVLMIRMMNFYIVTNIMGPNIIIIWQMMKDMVFFFIMFGILIYAYGASIQGLLYPNEFRISEVFDGIFRRPLLTVLGELFMQEVQAWNFEGPPDCTNATKKSGLLQNMADNTTLSMRCPQQNWFIKVLSLIYMMAANIILLNLLIAMFTHSFDRVKNNRSGDMDLWNSKRYALIKEYYRRPALVPPFNVFTIVAKMIETLVIFNSLELSLVRIRYKLEETKRRMRNNKTIYQVFGKVYELDNTIEELDEHFYTVSESFISKYRKNLQKETVEENFTIQSQNERRKN